VARVNRGGKKLGCKREGVEKFNLAVFCRPVSNGMWDFYDNQPKTAKLKNLFHQIDKLS